MAKKAKKPRVVRINRATWLTGEAVRQEVVESSKLRDQKTGLMCCWGFICNQLLRIPQTALVQLPAPSDLAYVDTTFKHKLENLGAIFPNEEDYIEDTPSVSRSMEANDNENLEPKVREQRIKEQLRKLNIRAVFYGKYPDYRKMKKQKELNEAGF
jgi:hypothetical protein